MRRATATLLTAELDDYDTDDEKLERYEDMLDLYKEFVTSGEKIRRRRNNRQIFPSEPRHKFGKDIMFASVSDHEMKMYVILNCLLLDITGYLHAWQLKAARALADCLRGLQP